jgi:hypothetical protein
MGNKDQNNAIIDVLKLMRNEIDSLPGLKGFHAGDPLYDEAIGIAKDKVFGSIEDMIAYLETDDPDSGDEEDSEGGEA